MAKRATLTTTDRGQLRHCPMGKGTTRRKGWRVRSRRQSLRPVSGGPAGERAVGRPDDDGDRHHGSPLVRAPLALASGTESLCGSRSPYSFHVNLSAPPPGITPNLEETQQPRREQTPTLIGKF